MHLDQLQVGLNLKIKPRKLSLVQESITIQIRLTYEEIISSQNLALAKAEDSGIKEGELNSMK